jgi:hypothetical protein
VTFTRYQPLYLLRVSVKRGRRRTQHDVRAWSGWALTISSQQSKISSER